MSMHASFQQLSNEQKIQIDEIVATDGCRKLGVLLDLKIITPTDLLAKYKLQEYDFGRFQVSDNHPALKKISVVLRRFFLANDPLVGDQDPRIHYPIFYVNNFSLLTPEERARIRSLFSNDQFDDERFIKEKTQWIPAHCGPEWTTPVPARFSASQLPLE